MTTENLMTDGHSTDFGKWQRISPRYVVVGGGAKGFRDALAIARSGGDDVVVRGRGHSCNGQTLSCGVVFVNQDDDLQPRLTAEGHVEIPSGLDWYTVERWLNRRGRTIPILTDHLHVSVGGTVSVGGLGVHAIRHGLQGDHVVRLRILDGCGEAAWCSRTEDHELFRFAAGGLGQAGFIDTVVMRTSEYRACTHISIVRHDSLAEMMEFAVAATEAPGIDLYNGYSSANRIISEVGFRSDDPKPPGHQRLALLRDAQIQTITDYPFASHSRRGIWMANFPHHFPLWADYMLGVDQMREFFGHADLLCRIPPLSHTVKALYFGPIRRASDAVSFAFAPALPGVRLTYGIGVYAMVDRRNPRLLTQTRQILRLLLERCVALGGRPYLYGVHDLDDTLVRRCYGSDVDRLHELRAQRGLSSINTGVFRDRHIAEQDGPRTSTS